MQGFTFELDDKMDDGDRLMLLPILTNTKLSEGYSTLARAIEPKIPWQVYKV